MVVFENVGKEFSGPRRRRVVALDDFSLHVRPGELLALVGPSGCGKTTALRLLAGLDTPDRGAISLDGAPLAGVAPRDRDLAMVFQHHALLPHLSVFENMAFGLMLRKVPRAEINVRIGRAAESLGLTALLERRPESLSGGEKQRAALGRALARQPKVFLFDEPFSNLDAPLRLQLRGQVAALRRQLGATMIFVTHDQAEALAIADRVAVMNAGRVQQAGTPDEVYRRPASRFVAGFIGSPPMNFFDGALVRSNGALVFRCGDGFSVAHANKGADGHVDGPITLGVRPENVVESSGTGGLPAVVDRLEAAGHENIIYLTVGGRPVTARWPATRAVGAGETCSVRFDAGAALLFDASSGGVIPQF